MTETPGADDTGGFGLAVAQFTPSADKAANLAAIRSFTARAVARNARLVVFPEYSSYFVHPFGEAMLDGAEPLDGAFVAALGALAVEFDCFLVAGVAETAEVPDRFSNAVVALDPAGRLVATYRKLHLYDAFGDKESDWVLAGDIDEPETFVVDGVTVGLQTCYDIRFPEVTRRLVDAGAELVLVPAEWVRGPLKEQHWRTLVTARALENTIYVAGAGQTPPIGVGTSLVVDPMGVALVSLGERPEVGVAWIDADRIAAVRRVNPALGLRRFGVTPL